MSHGPPTGFLLHPAAPLHDTGMGHPEHQGRLRALARAVERDLPSLHGSVVQVEPDEVHEADLLRVHDRELLERVRSAVEAAQARGRPSALTHDTVISGASWDAAVGSSGAAISAVRRVSEGELANAFVATRPPGHHATSDRAMGFCLLNHAAVAARWLQAHGRADRVLVVDWDVHHGNGTQDIFWRDGTVFYLSIHQSPHYPGTGSSRETGEAEGRGSTLNVPLRAATSREEYRARFTGALDQALESFAPDFVLVSSGFDVMAGDPLGGQLLEPDDLHAMTRQVMGAAAELCGGRVVALLEGGYVPDRLGEGTVAVLRALAAVGHEREGPPATPERLP